MVEDGINHCTECSLGNAYVMDTMSDLMGMLVKVE